MECYTKVKCPNCASTEIMKSGISNLGVQRYCCQNLDCSTKTFMLEYRYRAYEHGVKDQALEMAINGSGIRDTARVLNINKNTVINLIREKDEILVQVNPNRSQLNENNNIQYKIENVFETEMDEQWSYVGDKSNQRWLWYAVDHATNTCLLYTSPSPRDRTRSRMPSSA